MTSIDVHRVASVHLRTGWVRVYWPAPTQRRPALLVLFAGDDDALGRVLCVDHGAVVLSAAYDAVGPALAVLEWAADHGAELGADPTRLILAGHGPGADLAAAVASQAAENGWPPAELISIPDKEPTDG